MAELNAPNKVATDLAYYRCSGVYQRPEAIWRPAKDGFIESHCDRWRIVPLYGAQSAKRSRPYAFELHCDGKPVAKCVSQNAAKAMAEISTFKLESAHG